MFSMSSGTGGASNLSDMQPSLARTKWDVLLKTHIFDCFSALTSINGLKELGLLTDSGLLTVRATCRCMWGIHGSI